MYIRKHEKNIFLIYKKEMYVGIHPLTYNWVM